MGRIIGILNYKGGTAKTTTVVNLGAGLALRGSRVLCIDMDPQGSLAASLGARYTYSTRHLLLGAARPQACIVNARERLDMIASDASLLEVEGFLWKLDSRPAAYETVANRLRGLEEEYDYVLIDYSPSANLLGESVLNYTREVIVPVAMNYLSLLGTRQVVQTLKTIGQIRGHQVKLMLIVPTFFDVRLRKDLEAMHTLMQHFSGQVASPIHMNSKIAESSGHQMSIYEYAPRSSGAMDYARLVERVACYA